MLPGKNQKLTARQVSQLVILMHMVTDFFNETENYRSQNNAQKSDFFFPATATVTGLGLPGYLKVS